MEEVGLNSAYTDQQWAKLLGIQNASL